ncbi:MAG: dTMP kinase [Acidobacteria bacterium]|nr:dTMP kinase [Acidobacteriota bacterium]MBV9476931.1 dTMP kinase [Acidobacteriota bacterium]
MFITFEGPEGSGKSTQIQRLGEWFRAAGRACVVTKEPGGTPISDRIRAILLDSAAAAMDPMTELLLYAASRRQHVVEIIRPSLDRGVPVFCDRYTDATVAYQGYGRLLDLGRLETLNEWATGGLHPDLTLLFDIDEETGLARAHARNSTMTVDESRLEMEDLRFHRRVREGYLALALAEPKRFVTVDARGNIDEVFARTLEAVRARAPQLLA